MATANLVLLFFMAGMVSSSSLYNVLDYGAKGDSKTDDSQAFLKAWGAACDDQGSPTLLIPSSKAFLLSQTVFEGPCKSAIHVNLGASSKIVAPNKIWTNDDTEHWLLFKNINYLTIDGDGSGTFDGQGSIWWDCKSKDHCDSPPSILGIMGCQDVTMSGLNFLNSPSKHVSLDTSVRVHIHSLRITAPESSPNTDGIDINDSQHVVVTNSFIGTGDDCIAIGKGTSDLNITKITCGPGHGISIGSLGINKEHATAENIRVENCTLSNTMNGVRIKTWQGASGYARNITFSKIVLSSVDNPIIIDQYYCNGDHNCANSTSAVQVSNVSFNEINGTSSDDVAINLACSKTVACTGISMRNVRIQPATGVSQMSSYCLNAHGTKSGVITPDVPCLSP